jgi:hypothetical protein
MIAVFAAVKSVWKVDMMKVMEGSEEKRDLHDHVAGVA